MLAAPARLIKYCRSGNFTLARFASTSAMTSRDYAEAITRLNTLQSNFSVVDAIRKSGRSLNQYAIPEMIEFWQRLGYEVEDLAQLNIIHIAGTKGKGSTSAFISSILGQVARSPSPIFREKAPQKIGLYTSPHLRSVRERIQIDNEPLTEEQFAHYFFEVYDRLKSNPGNTASGESAPMPVYFRFLTLMAFHAYIKEGVDTAIIECGIGGEYDSTNIIRHPVVSGVTTLDIDHVAMLGGTVEEIAWHKAGIFKQDSRANEVFTTAAQPGKALEVLQERASERQRALVPVPINEMLADGTLQLGLSAEFQKTNASLALAITRAQLRALGVQEVPSPLSAAPLSDEFRRGLEEVKLGGRCETRHEGSLSWHIDGGHTLESIRLAGEWFASCVSKLGGSSKPSPTRILVFNQQTRDAPALARSLCKALSSGLSQVKDEEDALFSKAIFCTNITFSDEASDGGDAQGQQKKSGHYKPDLVSMNTSSSDVSNLSVQRGLAQVWKELDPGSEVEVHGTIQSSIQQIRELAASEKDQGRDTVVLVTGSLHLVGGVLEVLETT